MQSARLDLALQSGVWLLPPVGDIAVYRPRAGDDLRALPKDRVVVLTGFKPDHDHFAALGYRTAITAPPVSALICLPRAKDAAFALIAEAAAHLPIGALIAIDGQKTDGIDAVVKACRGLGLTVGEVLAKAHGKSAVVQADPRLGLWRAMAKPVADGFWTAPGVFSADGPDRGSQALAACLPRDLGGSIADLGAGWGYLAREILTRPGVKHLDLVEAEQDALDCARRNVTDSRAAFHWADATTFRPVRPWNAVVMNPPFHTLRAADPGLGQAFMRAAHRGLAPNGSLWLVANLHLPYDKLLHELFGDVQTLSVDGGFRVSRASYPVRAKR